MKILATYGLLGLGLLLCATSSAEVITNGLSMSEAQNMMEAAHYNQTGLDMAANNLSEDLRFWDVDQGVLIFRFSKRTGRILGMTWSGVRTAYLFSMMMVS